MERQYKDSGIEWIGRIPEGWKTSEVRRIMHNKSIKNKPDAIVLSLYRDYGIVPKDSRDDNHNVTSEDTTTYKYVEVGDFVINKMKAWQGSMAVSNYEGIISPAYYVCSFTDSNLERKYIHYLLRNEAYKPEYLRLSTGLRVGQWDLGIDDFMKIPIILPPLPEQQRIASYLDKKCGEIDALIALQEKMIAQLTEYKQAVITEAVTKGLDPNAKRVPTGIEWIGDVPEGWKVVPLRYLGRTQNGISQSGDYFGEGYPFVSYSDVYKNYSLPVQVKGLAKSSAKDQELFSVQAGDVFFTRTSETIEEIGFSSVCLTTIDNAVFAGFLIRFRPYKNAQINKDFSKYYFRCNIHRAFFVKEMNLVIRASLSQELLKSLPVILPPLPDQQRIASYLDTKCSEIDSLVALKRQKIESLNAYKKSVIYEAVTGKTMI